jgi:hypothetical protein
MGKQGFGFVSQDSLDVFDHIASIGASRAQYVEKD